jgi:hypothetical protein
MSLLPSTVLISDFTTSLATAIAIGGTSATLQSNIDDDGNTLPDGLAYFTLDGANSQKEHIQATKTGANLTAIKSVSRQGALTNGVVRIHRIGSPISITDWAHLSAINEVLNSGYASPTTPTTDYQLATKKYVDDLALGGTTTVDRLTVVGTCGEDVVAGNLLYLKTSDSKWWKTDADTATTIFNVVLGIAQGSGTTDGLITGGVLIKGVDANQTGMTANSFYFAGNTAGAISLTSGTNPRTIGIATATNKLFFDPEFDKNTPIFGISATGNDTYAITPTIPIGAYVIGKKYTFQAGTENTGACSLNINGLGAKAIKKDVSSDLVTGDILANQIVEVIYDGTNMQMVSEVAGLKDATKLVGIVPIANLQTYFTPQDIAIYAGTNTSGVHTTSNETGTVIYVWKDIPNNNGYLLRLAKDAITGNYYITHRVDNGIGSSTVLPSGITISGSYLYVAYYDGSTAKLARYSASDLSGVTVMTISGSAMYGKCFGDGTNIYIYKSSGVFTKYTISGTTATENSDITYTSAGVVESAISNNTYIYTTDSDGTSTMVVKKYAIAGGAAVSSTTLYNYLDSMGSGLFLFLERTTMLGIGAISANYNGSAKRGDSLNLTAITLP